MRPDTHLLGDISNLIQKVVRLFVQPLTLLLLISKVKSSWTLTRISCLVPWFCALRNELKIARTCGNPPSRAPMLAQEVEASILSESLVGTERQEHGTQDMYVTLRS